MIFVDFPTVFLFSSFRPRSAPIEKIEQIEYIEKIEEIEKIEVTPFQLPPFLLL